MNNINLLSEFRRCMANDGWWVVLRSFDLTKRSIYWNEKSQEAIDGPPWKFNDIIFRSRRVERPAYNSEDFYTRQQVTEVFDVVFFVDGAIRVKKEDILMEIPQETRFLDQFPRRTKIIEQFDVRHVEPKIESRTVIFNKCYCTRKVPKFDATLGGTIPVKNINI